MSIAKRNRGCGNANFNFVFHRVCRKAERGRSWLTGDLRRYYVEAFVNAPAGLIPLDPAWAALGGVGREALVKKWFYCCPSGGITMLFDRLTP